MLNGGERRCVLLLRELRRLTLELPAGTLVHVIATDPAAPLDLAAWCHLTGHTYLGPVPATDRPTYAIQTTASAISTDTNRPWHPTAATPGP